MRGWALVCALELRRLARDRRALVLAVLVPALAFPVLLLLTGELGDAAEERLAERDVAAVADLRALDEHHAARVRDALAPAELRVALEERPLSRASAAEALEAGRDLALVAEPPAGEGGRPTVVLVVDTSDERSGAGARRVEEALRGLAAEVRSERLRARLGGDPGAALAPEPRDVARAEDAAGGRLGALLPLFAVIVLVSGASFAALDAFAGEREAGTLETLLVQPLAPRSVAAGKLAAVVLVAAAALAANAASLFACLALGLGSLPSLPGGAGFGVAVGRVAVGLAAFLPCVALVAAVLCLVSARARTLQQGQLATLPLTLVALALAAPAMQPSVELGPLLALAPVSGSALALRDAAAGRLALGPGLLAVAAGLAWAGVALLRLGAAVGAERLLSAAEPAEERAARRAEATRAIRFGVLAALVVYVVGGRMQSADLVLGLAATLGLLVPGLALVFARGTARRTELSLPAALGLARPRAAHVAAGVLLAPALAVAMAGLATLQERALPMPGDVRELQLALEEALALPLPAALALLALAPGVAEELLFRGALLTAMRRDLPALSAALWQALLFGLVHASVTRFAPTAAVGLVLAAVALRSRSVWPAVALHVAYDAAIVLAVREVVAPPAWGWLLAAGAAGAALLAVPARGRAAA